MENTRTLDDIQKDIDNLKIKINLKKEELVKLEKNYIVTRNSKILSLKDMKNEFGRTMYTNNEVAKKVEVKISVVNRVIRENKQNEPEQ